MKNQAQQADHFSDLDGMRGILAVTVMLSHIGLNTILERFLGVGNASWGFCVDFFFVLSGFVLCKSICSQPTDLPRFMYKRLWRLFPLHVAILLIFSFVLFSAESTFLDYLLNFTTFSAMLGKEMVNVPAWSMSFEFFVPILLLALIPWPQLGRSTITAGSIGLMIVYSYICYHHAAFGMSEFFTHIERHLRAFFGLTFGFFLWRLFDRKLHVAEELRDRATFQILALTFFPLVILSAIHHELGVLFPPFFALCMLYGMRARGFLSSRPFQFLGRLSFGIYMVHSPMIILYLHIFGVDEMDGNIPLKLSLVGATVALAAILHYTVELPGMRLGRHFFSITGRRRMPE